MDFQHARRRPLTMLLMSTALCAVMVPTMLPVPQALAQVTATRDFNIPSQPLDRALRLFADQSGVQLAYRTAVASGATGPAVGGAMTVEQALARLLAGSGLRYSFTDASTVTILGAGPGDGAADADGMVTLKPVMVEGMTGPAALQRDGTAADGYRAGTVSSVGPLGPTPLKDTPFSMSVVPRELLENIQAQSPDEVFRINPYTRTMTPQISGWSPMVNMRGFSTYDSAEDGLRRPYSFATSLEDKERVEILTGLSGFLYGATAPAGMVNYVFKRPTIDRLNRVTAGTYGGGQKFIHGDFGGRIDDGRVGYRLNVVRQDGETSTDDQSIDRILVSGAFDVRLADRLKLELDAGYSRYEMTTPSSYWAYQAGVPHGKTPDAGKNWSQPWIKDVIEKKRISGKLIYELSDSITLRGAVKREYSDRPTQDHTMNNVRTPGTYHQIAIRSGETRSVYDAAQAMADITFTTGPVSHKMTVGYYMYSDKSWSTTYSPNTGWTGPYSMAEPVRLPEPVFPVDNSSPYYSGYVRNHNFFVGDWVDLAEQWSVLAGINYSRILGRSFNSAGVQTQPGYNEGRLSPSVSLMYRPMPWMTVYGTYVEGLERGGVAPTTARNSGTVMAPMVSTQKEIGVKAELGGVLLTGALFDIEKAYELTNANGVYTQDGRQKHRGLELTATGKLTENLTIVGGFTLLDAEVKGGANDGKEPINVARTLAKLYAEYRIPAVDGLFLTGGVYRTGEQWATAVNDDRLPAYTTVDLGARYMTELFDNPLALRLNVTNLTDKNYWQNSYYIGAPRTVMFSAQMSF